MGAGGGNDLMNYVKSNSLEDTKQIFTKKTFSHSRSADPGPNGIFEQMHIASTKSYF